jgi:hypothetical protein
MQFFCKFVAGHPERLKEFFPENLPGCTLHIGLPFRSIVIPHTPSLLDHTHDFSGCPLFRVSPRSVGKFIHCNCQVH